MSVYSQLTVNLEDGIAHVVIDNPPVNVLGYTLITEIDDVLRVLADDENVRVIVFTSANPEFFLAHVDMTLGAEPDAVAALMARAPQGLNPFQALSERVRQQPQVTIVALSGLARGGGAEFVLAADMAFAAIETAGLGQIEALMGILPAGGGTQYLTDRLGRNRALEVMLSAELFDAETAASYGWVNRALPAAQLEGFVDALARKIAALPDGVAAAIKRTTPPAPLAEGFARETEAWAGLIAQPAAGILMSESLVRGAQTPDGERDLEGLLRAISASAS